MNKSEVIKEQFFKGITDWENFLPLMYFAMQETEGDIVECGVGGGGSQKIHDYCEFYNRRLYSFESDNEWLEQFKHLRSEKHIMAGVQNWDMIRDICPNPSVVLVDSSPGHIRVDIIRKFADINGIVCVHDSQPPPTAADYKFETIWPLFKYKVDLQVDMNHEVDPPHQRTWATAVSNHYDVTKWARRETTRPDYRIV